MDAFCQITVRSACLADIPSLGELLALLFTQEADFIPDVERQERGLRMILDDVAVGMIWCAEGEVGVVGMVSLLFSVSTAEGGRAAWLEDLVVKPEWRGRGIGRRLLETALAGAREAGCLRVSLLTDRMNETAQHFYECSGFSRSAMVPMRVML